jgi:hypothetical protein
MPGHPLTTNSPRDAGHPPSKEGTGGILIYNWHDELAGYFDRMYTEKTGDMAAASKQNKEIEDFLIVTAIPAFEGLKQSLAERKRSLHIDKDRQSVRVAVRYGDTTEFVYELKVKHVGSRAAAVKVLDGRESIIEPQASKNDNSIASLTEDDIRNSFVFEYIAAMGS